ncbi:Fe2+-dependent dioxygenase [Enterovirga rhinocerotis]|uniref:PKHD-type hydroxylase n=1 Tax=Enterovirga rhinocerotis TaxID=1339210 RepID=A0A4R7BML0_9HYPH|nr:Fe2+-dependent dioxygenase [Enterovirga rhinocerotis]TDR85136.1 PKHD-type hydroxylase [Enterovirga rhinocerotis]
MLVEIPNVLTPDEARQCREMLEKASWQDGRDTAGHIAARVKDNQQLPPDDPVGQQIGSFLLERLAGVSRFVAAALPMRVMPPRFNRHADKGTYGDHIDNAIFGVPGTSVRIRGDLSATLFLTDPADYEGGELEIQGEFARHQFKLPAGHMVLYSARTLHQVKPVTRGARIGSFFWIQSLVREDSRRAILLELDDTIQSLAGVPDNHATVSKLTGIYHNLLREWSDT